jgi:hypothetical protein
MISDQSIYELMLAQFRACRSLHIIGAGASVGLAPLGTKFWKASPIDYLRNFRPFPVAVPAHSLLVQRMVDASRGLTLSDIFPEWEIRPGTQEPPYWEILQRIPDYRARLHVKYLLSKAHFDGQQCDNYRVFRHFYPSLISNYNHDGLAAVFCGRQHHVFAMHGTTERHYGSPEIAKLVDLIENTDLQDEPDGLIMGIPEPLADAMLRQRLKEQLKIVAGFSPQVISIIGYSFAQNGDGFDDSISLECFLRTRRDFPGAVYVVQPDPYVLREMIADGIKSNNVLGVSARWNVLAHAYMRRLFGECARRSLYYVHEQILDKYGRDDVVFPISDS